MFKPKVNDMWHEGKKKPSILHFSQYERMGRAYQRLGKLVYYSIFKTSFANLSANFSSCSLRIFSSKSYDNS